MNAALRAVMELNPDAFSIATQLDLERAQGKLRGSETFPPPLKKNLHIYVVRIPNLLRRLLMRMMFRPLHGLPVLIKGNIGTRDRMQTNGESIEINLEVQI